MRMIITGGGTGGHLFPGIAVAEAMLGRFPNGELLFVSTDRAIDGQALNGRAFARAAIRCRPIKGSSILGTIRSLFGLPFSLYQALRLVRQFRPDLVFGVGGYVTGPVVLAGRLLGVKTCIHEQNSVPGMANRILGKIVDRVCLSIPGSEEYFDRPKSVMTGNPVRAELLAAASAATEVRQGRTLLVLGGSQGAHRVNTLLIEALCGTDRLEKIRVVHQTGKADAAWVADAYKAAAVEATVFPFIEEMAAAYRQADLVVSRAGATTLAELAVLGKPAILIPYPYAADDHQTTNAAFLAKGGAARLCQERSLDAHTLRTMIGELFADRAALATMAARMQDHGRPGATEAIIEECLHLMAEQGGRADVQ